ncbi:hypothetical protein Bca4012_089271 [Brassica carinata]
MEDQSHASRKEKLRFNDHKKNQVFFNKGKVSERDRTQHGARVEENDSQLEIIQSKVVVRTVCLLRANFVVELIVIMNAA